MVLMSPAETSTVTSAVERPFRANGTENRITSPQLRGLRSSPPQTPAPGRPGQGRGRREDPHAPEVEGADRTDLERGFVTVVPLDGNYTAPVDVVEALRPELEAVPPTPGPIFRRGDCNGDGAVDISDAVLSTGCSWARRRHIGGRRRSGMRDATE